MEAQGDVQTQQFTRTPHGWPTLRSLLSTVTKVTTLGSYATGSSFADVSPYISAAVNIVSFGVGHVIEGLDHNKARKDLAESKTKFDDIRSVDRNIATVVPAEKNIDTYGLNNTQDSKAVSVIMDMVSIGANLCSNVCLILYNYRGKQPEEEYLNNIALAAGVGAMGIHWFSEHFKRVNIAREKEMYDKANKRIYEVIRERFLALQPQPAQAQQQAQIEQEQEEFNEEPAAVAMAKK